MNENRDGSDRFLADESIGVRMADGSLRYGSVNEYEEDGISLSVGVDGRDYVFPVERCIHIGVRHGAVE